MAGPRGVDFLRIEGALSAPDAAIESVRRALEARVSHHIKTVYEEARDKWPIKTGNSLEALFWEFEWRGPSFFVGRVGNRAKYARFIRSNKVGRKARAVGTRAVLIEDVAKPTRSAQKELIAESAEVVGKALGTVLG